MNVKFYLYGWTKLLQKKSEKKIGKSTLRFWENDYFCRFKPK